jgi:putative phosphoesterase
MDAGDLSVHHDAGALEVDEDSGVEDLQLPITIGVLSDSHGSLDQRVFEEFADVSLIIHAGDIGGCVLEELEVIAPVRAVQGNMDSYAPGTLPDTTNFVHAGVRFYVKHELYPGDHTVPSDVDVVVAGHTHLPEIRDMREYLLVNPGSISRSRTSDRVNSAAIITIDERGHSASILRFP